jgi:hypothetical protein
MSSTEDRARAAMRAIAGTVNDAPPLQLRPAREPERAHPRPRIAGNGPRRPGTRAQGRWRPWLAPATAAAVVIALAISLVTVRDLPNGGAVAKGTGSSTTGSSTTGPSTTGPAGAPRYYVALKEVTETGAAQVGTLASSIVVGDSLTGRTLATFAAPARTTFQSVEAAADDLTFVVFAVTSSAASSSYLKGATLTGSWYKVSLAPGTAEPARLSRLPVTPWSWAAADNVYLASSPGQIYATALSQSGQELAVADIPDVAAADKPQNWVEVKVFSVATGRLLDDWTEDDPTAKLMTVAGASMAGVPFGTSPLTWVDGDRGLTLATSHDVSDAVTGTVRRLNLAGTGTVRRLKLAGPTAASLVANSTVVWSGTLTWNDGCFSVDAWPPQLSADGSALTCLQIEMPESTPGHVDFGTVQLAPGTSTSVAPTVVYRAPIPPEKQTGGIDSDVLWVSSSARTLIVELVPGGNLSPPRSADFGVVSQGKFTALRMPTSLASSSTAQIAF